MGMEWYDMIARRNGGYKSNAVFTVEGLSGEDVFEERLIHMLPNYHSVLDAGCGHGEFTLKMAEHAHHIVGFDWSVELLKIAETLRKEKNANNVRFVLATTKKDLPFQDDEFDLIYVRRGPGSIMDHSRVLRHGGTIIGIHSAALEGIKEGLECNGFMDIEIEEFDEAIAYYPNEVEFMKAISSIPGNPDYSLPENRDELNRMIQENRINGRLGLKQWRYIWKARKP